MCVLDSVCLSMAMVSPLKATVTPYQSHLQTVLSLSRRETREKKSEEFGGMHNEEEEETEGNEMGGGEKESEVRKK